MGTARAGRSGLTVVNHMRAISREFRNGGIGLCKAPHSDFDSSKTSITGFVAIFSRFCTKQLNSPSRYSGAPFIGGRAGASNSGRKDFTSAAFRRPDAVALGWASTTLARNFKVRSAVFSRGAVGVRQIASSVGSGSRVTTLAGRNLFFGAIQHYGKCYFELSKARLSMFVVSTAAVGFIMGSGEFVDWGGLAWTSVGTMLTASSANAFNQLLEISNDARMKRTMRRPLPSGRIGSIHALTFAVAAGVSGVTILASQTTEVAAQLGAANLLLYTLVYTPLKQIHCVNTWVGAVVGAIPPLLGWAAASGQVDKGAWVLASALYFWQIPHFMALAFLCREDYARGGYKMLSLLDTTGRRTAACAIRSCVYLLPLGFLAHHWGTTTGYFGPENVLLTLCMGATSIGFYLRPRPESARRVFRTSLVYLPLVMTAMVGHRIPNPQRHYSEMVRTQQPFAVGGLLSTLDEDGSDRALDLEQSGVIQRREKRREAPQSPISFLSAAPFPFLPAPDYS